MTTDERLLSGASSESSLPPNKSSGDIGELKPCPWCGSTASRVRIMSRDAIQCDGENCGVIKRTPDEWNTRAPDPESAAEIERLRREIGEAKAQVAFLIDRIEYSDSYGVPGSDFKCCHLCNGGGAPGVIFEHDSHCPVLRCEPIAAMWWEERDEEWKSLELEAKASENRALTAESSVAAAWEEAAKVADERASREKRFQVACINNGDHARAGEHAQARVACDAIASAIRAAVSKKTGEV